MAGRPKKQYERIHEIDNRAASLYQDVDQLTPQMHKDRAGCGDRLGDAWNKALDAMGEAWRAIHCLRGLLAVRAGVGALTDVQNCVDVGELDESCNPTADDCSLDSVIVIDGDAATLAQWAKEYNRPIQLILKKVRAGMSWEEAVMDPIDHADDTVIAMETEQQ